MTPSTKPLLNLVLRKNDASEVTFSSLLQQRTKYGRQVRWYLALAYLGQQKMDLCTNYLASIKFGDFNGASAKKIAKDLKHASEYNGE